MNIDRFFSHYQITENPFRAEEARLDPILERLADDEATHPDFPKILGQVDQPSTSIVFGEKGAGKTAIRLLLERRIAEHNAATADRRVLVVAYDDLNPVLDRLLQASGQRVESVLKSFRLEDHQDAILSRAVTKLTHGVLGEASEDEAAPMPSDLDGLLKRMPRTDRADLAVLIALYDQPARGTAAARWQRVRSRLRLGWKTPLTWILVLAVFVSVIAAGLGATQALTETDQRPWWLTPALALSVAAAVLSWGWWLWRVAGLWWRCWRIRRAMPAVRRATGELRQMLGEFTAGELARQPLPQPGAAAAAHASDARYQLTRRFVDLLSRFGFAGMTVLIDRVDEPTLVAGDADRMVAIMRPVFESKFLQQQRVGLKLLLPIELRHWIYRESPRFFQEARLDKQNVIDRLEWSGATLYDLCSARLNACRPADAPTVKLTDLFEDDVTSDMLIDALDQMHQPRDAMKFLYAVIQEHCRLVPQEQAVFQIARLTLEQVRRAQAQRVQDFSRGLSPV